MRASFICFLVLPVLILSGCGGGDQGGGMSAFTVSATVVGLVGTVELRNGDEQVAVSADGTVTFETRLAPNDEYDVSVAVQPAGQTCTVSNGNGRVWLAPVSDIEVTCGNNFYSISAAVSGLNGTLKLQLNGEGEQVVESDGNFLVLTEALFNTHYGVTLLAQPLGQACVLSNGGGIVTGNVEDIVVSCSDFGVLDEQSDANVVAYFYAGMPVKGLIYICSLGSVVQYSGKTDINGRFVCPRNTTASFFVGEAGVKVLKLGQVELSIFGLPDTPNKRSNVVITPATLFGSAVSGSRHEVANIFNLLHSLDVQYPGLPGRKQKIIDLDPAMLSTAVGDAAFASLITDGVSSLPSQFDSHLNALVNALSASHDLTLSTTRTGAPTLELLEAVEVADAALLRARSGLYRTASTMLDSQTGAIFLGTAEFMVGADGMSSGYTVSEEFSSTSPAYALNVLDLDAAARVHADGSLQGFTFGSGTRQLDFVGALINDAIWGEWQLCQPANPNEFVPVAYCNTPASDGGFSLLDVGVFESARGFNGELLVGQPLLSLPDIDLDNLPLDFLPRTFELELARYTDVQYLDLYNSDLTDVSADKTAFGPLAVMPQKMRYTLMPNGDIVSDVDADCSNLAIVNGRYEDEDLSREYLIGRIGSVFLVDVAHTPDVPEDDTPYLNLYLNVLDAAHPSYGLNVGLGAAFHRSLHAMVLEAPTGLLSSRSCDPTVPSLCRDKVEWFDTIAFVNDVLAIDRSTSQLTATDIANYRNVAYYGQVTRNDPVVGAPGGVCRP